MVSIRSLAEADRTQWLALWRGYQAFYGISIPDASTAATWARLLDGAEPVHGAAAVQSGEPVGIVHWILHRSTWSAADTCYLQDLFVLPEARGAGIGRALIEHVYAAARAAGCGETYWLTHEDNHTARALYDRVAAFDGFVQYQKVLERGSL